MAKRMPEQKEENKIVAKSKPTAMTLVRSVPASSSSVSSPIASRSPGILKASSRQVGLSSTPSASANQNSNPDAASTSQGWQKDAQLSISTGRPVATDKDQKSLNRQERSVISRGEPVAIGYLGYLENSRKLQMIQKIRNSKVEFGHIISVNHQINVDHMEKVFSIIRKTYDRKPTDDLTDLDVNTATWSIFMSVTLSSCSSSWDKIIGKTYDLSRINLSKSVKQLFRTTEKLIKDQVEITGLSTIDWNQPMWRESSLLCDRAVHIMKSKTPTSLPTRCYVWEALVLHQSKLGKTKLNGIWRHALSQRFGSIIDGLEFEWKNFPGFTTLGILDEIQKMMAELRYEPEQFKGRIIFMSMYNDIIW